MDATTWLTISIVGYSLAGVLLIASVWLFFKMNIRSIIGDLTGRTEARQIQEIREQIKNNGNRIQGVNALKVENVAKPAGFFTNRLRSRGKTDSLLDEAKHYNHDTATFTKINKDSDETVLLYDETELLANSSGTAETEILSNETEILHSETELLSNEDWDETTVLNVTEGFSSEVDRISSKSHFKIIKDIKITHTSEVI